VRSSEKALRYRHDGQTGVEHGYHPTMGPTGRLRRSFGKIRESKLENWPPGTNIAIQEGPRDNYTLRPFDIKIDNITIPILRIGND